MLLSRNFVSDYIDLDKSLDIKDIALDMTNVGNEFDSANKLIECSNLITGEVLECKNHPDSDHLHICRVDVGDDILDIVCGALNVRVGLKVIVALPGAKLPGGEIKKSVIRGFESNGMLCSIKELGLDNKFLTKKDIDGIHELPLDTKVGIDPIKVLGLDDEVIDFELTSNRGDLLSILGMAYELGAIYDKKVKDIDLFYKEDLSEDISSSFKVSVDTDDCTLFLAKKVKNVEIKESPSFIKSRLIASGIRPINNVVDISNYVMLETGQPLHFYDASNLGDTIIVRNAKKDEILLTLDGASRNLLESDIVIANKDTAIGLAGVMGGMSTEVEDNTNSIIIESAIFNNIKIRKTAKRILRTEASSRFEKGLDPNRTYMAIKRACHLLEKYASATITSGMITYDKEDKSDKTISITLEKINKVLGINISLNEVINIFERLGFNVIEEDNALQVTVPKRRLDISIKEDLIEEVGRIYGMDKIIGKLPVFTSKIGAFDRTKRELKNKLASLGLNETLTYSLIPNASVHKYTNDLFEEVLLADPMTNERDTLRYSLISSLREVYDYNTARNIDDVSIFEIGKGFYKQGGEYREKLKLAILLSGNYYLSINKVKADFYILKGIVEEVLDFLGFSNRYSFEVSNIPSEFHKGASASVNVQGKNIGVLGKIHPSICKRDVYAFEIDLSALLELHPARMSYKDIPKYPSVLKDVAFIVEKDTYSSEIERVIKTSGGKLLKNIEVFDIYTGSNIGDDKKSIAYSLTFSDSSRTLSDEEVNIIFNKIIKDVEEKCGAILRNS